MENLERNLIEEKISAMGADMRHRAMCQKILALNNGGANIEEISINLNISTNLVGQILL